MKQKNRLVLSFLVLQLAFLLFICFSGCSVSRQILLVENTPVPEAVAIARPTADEVQLAERSLSNFLRNADPAIKEISRI